MIKKFLKTVLLIFLVVVLLFAALVLGFRFIRNADKTAQLERLVVLRDNPPLTVAIPDTMLDDALRLNQIRYLATHNSYHGQAGALQLVILDIAESGEAAKLRYTHQPLYDQLELGVRSFEFDLRTYRSGKIENIHVPLVDNRGSSPVFELALEEMKLWSDRHPDHVPVIVIMETKNDWGFLDPGLKEWTPEYLLNVDTVIENVLGDRLILPGEFKVDGWPVLGNSRGKFIFVFHESDQDCFNGNYFAAEGRVSFYMHYVDSAEALFVLRNEADIEEIRTLVNQGFIVRTRADSELAYSDTHKNRAIASGAQIVSTDFPLGYPSNPPEYSLGWQELLSRYLY